MKERAEESNKLLVNYFSDFDKNNPIDQLTSITICHVLSNFKHEIKKEYEKKERTMTNGELIYKSIIIALEEVKRSIEKALENQ